MNLRRAAGAAALITAAATFAATAGIAHAGATGSPSSPTPASSGPFTPGQVLVQFRTETSLADQAAVVHAAGAENVGAIRDLRVDLLKVPDGAEQRVIDALLRSGKVTFAEPNGVVRGTDVTPNDPMWTSQWGSKRIGVPTAWSTSTGSAGVTIAVVDSGLAPSLSEFAGRVLPGYNFVANTTDVTDDNGHGTAVAGVALAQGNNATGIAGMCWTCSILPVKVTGANGTGTESALAAGITWAADHGARVMNLSVGATTQSSTLTRAVAYAQSKGTLLVAASGNNSTNAPFYPADDPGVLSVAASDQYDKLFSYSDYGSWVSVAAPGSNYTVAPNGTAENFGGTSSAAPVIAGLAGLLASAVPTATAGEISAAITSTTDPLTAGAVATGRVNAANAMASLTGGSPTASPSPTPSGTTSSPAPSPSPSPSSSSSSTPTPPPSPSPTATTGTFSGSLASGASRSYGLTTTAGVVSTSIGGTTSSVSVSIMGANGSIVATASGGSGTSVSASLPAGPFSVVIKSLGGKTKFKLTVSY